MKTAALAKVESSPDPKLTVLPREPRALNDLTILELEATHAQLDQLERLHNNMSGSTAVLRGLVLAELKRKLPHGQWMPWVKRFYRKKSHRSATGYMQLAREFLGESKLAEHCQFALLLQGVGQTLEQIEAAKLDLSHPVVSKVVGWVKGRSAYQLLLGLENRGGDNTPRDKSGKRIADRRRTKVEIEQEKFENDAKDACGVVAAKLEALLDLSGPHKQTAWEILDEETLPGFKQLLYRSYQGVLDLEKRRTAARRYGKR